VPQTSTQLAMELDDAKYRRSSGSKPQILAHDEQIRGDASSSVVVAATESYRLYKRRWAGLVGLVSPIFHIGLSVC
jgi:hypothetical protein